MEVRAVFFDLGGTLLVMRRDRIFRMVLLEQGLKADLDKVHSAYLAVESWWLSNYSNRVLTPDESREAFRELDAKVFRAIFPKASRAEADKLSRIIRDRWPELEKRIPLELYRDAEPLLKRLYSEGYSMALVSNAPPDTDRVVQELGLGKYLEPVVISGVVGYSKPHPEIFRIALRQAGVRADQTIHVGDLYESDVVGARNAGIQGILIDREGIRRGVDCPRIGDLSEVYRFLH